MRRTLNARAVSALALAAMTIGLLAGVFAPGVASARLAATTAKSTTMCFASGTITANPPLTLGSGKATTLTFHATMHGCTGSAASKVTQATFTGKSTDTSASCVAFENAFPPLSGKVTYKTTSGSLTPTKLSFSAGKLLSMATPTPISYPSPGEKGTAKGSFATSHATMNLNLSVPYAQWVSMCQSSSGLATMTLAPTSSATL
ncbi:MAG TPA: hypothetical protein VK773_07680 [Acidimicrobiales bacterium]|jgi:hypothetical protein|nr:hypothetical protein [Acidimicrobiales bacterium]